MAEGARAGEVARRRGQNLARPDGLALRDPRMTSL